MAALPACSKSSESGIMSTSSSSSPCLESSGAISSLPSVFFEELEVDWLLPDDKLDNDAFSDDDVLDDEPDELDDDELDDDVDDDDDELGDDGPDA